MTRIAIMQPYFMPYLGYFRLFAATDVFVVYDCVQFPQRGYVHRNRLTDREGKLRWLTLPLVKAPRDTAIEALRLQTDEAELDRRMRPFPALERPSPLKDKARAIIPELVDYLESTLEATCQLLGLSFNVARSSAFGIDRALRGQDRILALAEALGATTYVNAPGGRALYDADAFRRRKLALEFLPEYRGDYASILERVAREDPKALRKEIEAQL